MRHLNGSIFFRFATLSFLCVVALALAMGFALSSLLTRAVSEWEWENTAALARYQVELTGLETFFNAPQGPEARERWGQELSHLFSRFPEVIRVKAWDREAVVLWSDQPALIGQRFPDNRELQTALSGRVAVLSKALTKTEHAYERGSYATLVEVYVPLFSKESGQVGGVLEVYKTPDRLLATIRWGKMVIWGISLAGGLALYLILLPLATNNPGVPGGVPYKLGQGVPGLAAAQRRGTIVNDYQTSPYAEPRVRARGIGAVIAQPLLRAGQSLGVITVTRLVGASPFTAEDLELLGTFAGQVLIALENARLYEQERHARDAAEGQAQQLAILMAISAALSSSIRLEEILQRVGPEVLKHTRYDELTITLVEDDGKHWRRALTLPVPHGTEGTGTRTRGRDTHGLGDPAPGAHGCRRPRAGGSPPLCQRCADARAWRTEFGPHSP